MKLWSIGFASGDGLQLKGVQKTEAVPGLPTNTAAESQALCGFFPVTAVR